MSSRRQAAIGFVFVTVLLDFTGIGIGIPIMPTLISQLAHVTNSDAAAYNGWIAFCYALMIFIFAPVFGGISDRFGRRPVLLLSLLGYGLSYVLLALAPSIGWIFVARIIAGIMGSSITTAMAYVADITSPEKRAQNFGKIGAALGLGFILGPTIGGLLGGYGLNVPFWFAAVLALLNTLYGFFVLPESLKPGNRRKFEWRRANPIGSFLKLKKQHHIIKGLVISLILFYLAAFAIQSTWAYYTIEKFDWDTTMIGYSLGVVGIALVIVQGGLMRVIIPKFGQEKSIYFGLSMSILGFLLFSMASQGWMMFVFSFIYSIGTLSGPAMQGIMSSLVPANEQGELQGALSSLQSSTALIGPLFMTQLFRFFTRSGGSLYFPGAPMAAGALLTLISGLWAFKILSRRKAVA